MYIRGVERHVWEPEFKITDADIKKFAEIRRPSGLQQRTFEAKKDLTLSQIGFSSNYLTRVDELDVRVRWCELDARYRLYQSQNLQENMRWKALAEIYTMHSFAPFSKLIFP